MKCTYTHTSVNTDVLKLQNCYVTACNSQLKLEIAGKLEGGLLYPAVILPASKDCLFRIFFVGFRTVESQ